MNRSAARLARGGSLLAALLGVLGGCAAGRVSLAALDFNSIDPPAARVFQVDLREAFWWEDPDGRVHIALERRGSVPLLPSVAFDVRLLLALERLPAGRARNYLVSREELRGVARIGPAQTRFTAAAGIAALYRHGASRMRGALRLRVARQVHELLGGWGPPANFLMLGEFVARHDPVRGAQIAALVEREWGGAPTSQPGPAEQRTVPAQPAHSAPAN